MTAPLFDPLIPAAGVAAPVPPAAGTTVGRAEPLRGGAARPALDADAPVGGSIWTPGVEIGDVERALILMAAVAPGSGEYVSVRIPGEPASKSRPRFTRTGRPYRTKEDVDAEKRTAEFVRRAFRHGPWTGNVALAAVFFRPNRQRIDADNMLKHVCDAANEIAWLDDSQVTAILGVTELDAEQPRTILVFARHVSSLRRGSDDTSVCAACGVTFQRVSNNPNRKTCGADCSRALRGMPNLGALIPCAACETPFRRFTTRQRFCSSECGKASLRGRRKSRAHKSACTQCGSQLAHNRGGRCRDCWRASPAGQPEPVQGALEIGP